MDGFQIIKKWRLNSSFWPSRPLLVWFQPRIPTPSPAAPLHVVLHAAVSPASLFCAFPGPWLCSLYSCSLGCHSFVCPPKWNLSFQARFRRLIHQETTPDSLLVTKPYCDRSALFFLPATVCVLILCLSKAINSSKLHPCSPPRLGYIYGIIH